MLQWTTIKSKWKSSALTALAIVLLGSAIFRSIPLVAPAFALVSDLTSDARPEENQGSDAPNLGQLLEMLQEREARLIARERAILDRERAQSLTNTAILAKLAELEAAEAKLSNTIAVAEAIFEEDLIRLTDVYEEMKPKQAAALFEEMEPSFAAGFLARMRPEKSASVMAAMSPRAAYSISVIMAGRNANVPRD
jgi:flagellar motility protein MotE (MotC chaperone)